MTHSILAPSAAGIWGKPGGCTAYPVLSMMYPTEDTEESREGTLAHEIAADMITRAAKGDTSLVAYDVDDAIIDGALLYANDAIEVMRSLAVFSPPYLGIETTVSCPRIHNDSYGTPDLYIYAPSHNRLVVWDFKFGFGIVDEYENWQCINYIGGLLDKFDINGIADQTLTVDIRIVQPRAFHRRGPIRNWTVNASDLRGHINQLRMNADESLSDRATQRSGEHCRYCPVRFDCPTAMKAGVTLYEAANKPETTNATPEQLALQYTIVQRAKKQLEWLESGISEQLKSLMKSGASIPGYSLESTFGRQKWTQPPQVIASTAMMCGIDISVPSVLTPKQSIAKGLEISLVDSLTETPRTGLKLVRDDNKAMRIFK